MAKKIREEVTPLKFDIRHLRVRIVGDSPLLCNRRTDEMTEDFARRNLGLAKKKRANKTIARHVADSLYRIKGKRGYFFPAGAFKSALVSAAGLDESFFKTTIRAALHIDCELVQIVGNPVTDERWVKLGGAGHAPDLRWRGRFDQWTTVLTIRYNATLISADQIINLLKLAGFSIGVGDGRPSKSDHLSFGLFHPETA